MKRKLSAVLAAILLLSVFSAAVFAANYKVSPGLEILRSKCEVKKCGIVNTPVTFSEADLDKVIGKADYITILSLPDRACGSLKLGGNDLLSGQTVTRRGLSGLQFVPNRDTVCTASFTFRDASSKDDAYGVCTVYILESVNRAPQVPGTSLDTPKNISYKGCLEAHDPENDEMTFSIVSGTSHGILQLLCDSTGLILYTPNQNYTGRDTFIYKVTDKYGNTSESAKAVIHINETECDETFSDMCNHWAHACAIELSEQRLMTGKTVDGRLCFEPESTFSRGDFLAVAMIEAGLEDKVKRVYKTSFSDDNSIPLNIKSYAEAAYSMGIISGNEIDGKVFFDSTSPITRSEACVILACLIGDNRPESISAQSAGVSFFSDAESIPDWAKGPAEELACAGIISGTDSSMLMPNKALTRAEAAQLMCNLKEYLENTASYAQ